MLPAIAVVRFEDTSALPFKPPSRARVLEAISVSKPDFYLDATQYRLASERHNDSESKSWPKFDTARSCITAVSNLSVAFVRMIKACSKGHTIFDPSPLSRVLSRNAHEGFHEQRLSGAHPSHFVDDVCDFIYIGSHGDSTSTSSTPGGF
ncbi:hypothetical protein BDY19DRAFT_728707 [Irpex rosettiformis]|uniref:Uncharacterized protein n=1 Tax=Irpex rosettiformis TaxID=378272 RepID=A0ACB8U8P9_9APHY|nr:hypothetical protein BDY19DRAFT_728707 [Irpex rosettiformis]